MGTRSFSAKVRSLTLPVLRLRRRTCSLCRVWAVPEVWESSIKCGMLSSKSSIPRLNSAGSTVGIGLWSGLGPGLLRYPLRRRSMGSLYLLLPRPSTVGAQRGMGLGPAGRVVPACRNAIYACRLSPTTLVRPVEYACVRGTSGRADRVRGGCDTYDECRVGGLRRGNRSE